MEINKIIKLKNNKYKIYIDNTPIITYDNVILHNDLLYKKSIDNNLYDKILIDTNYYNVYDKVVKYILKRRRSEKEIILYLNKYDIDNLKIKEMINKLKEIKLINDVEYCKAYINDKLYLSKDGINKIKNDLLKQNISIQVIEDEFKKINGEIFNNRLEKLIIKKIKQNKKHSNNYLKQKILNEMINLGYNKEEILTIIDNNIIYDSEGEVLKKEFDKIYNKLKNKYDCFELNTKVKQKLLKKGFSIENIEKLLKEKTEK